MSAKWRRSKKSLDRFNIFRAISKARKKRAPQVPWIKKTKSKKKVYAYKRRKPEMRVEGRNGEPDPLIDVLEEEDEIVVVAELACFNEDNFKVHVKDQRLILSATMPNHKYRKSLNLPKRVIPDALSTTYKNRVLEIRLKKAADEKPIDRVAG